MLLQKISDSYSGARGVWWSFQTFHSWMVASRAGHLLLGTSTQTRVHAKGGGQPRPLPELWGILRGHVF